MRPLFALIFVLTAVLCFGADKLVQSEVFLGSPENADIVRKATSATVQRALPGLGDNNGILVIESGEIRAVPDKSLNALKEILLEPVVRQTCACSPMPRIRYVLHAGDRSLEVFASFKSMVVCSGNKAVGGTKHFKNAAERIKELALGSFSEDEFNELFDWRYMKFSKAELEFLVKCYDKANKLIPSTTKESSEKPKDSTEIVFRATVQDIETNYPQPKPKSIPVHDEPFFALSLKIISSTPVIPEIQYDKAVVFGIHSQTQLFAINDDTVIGKSYDFLLTREMVDEKPEFTNLRLSTETIAAPSKH